MNLGKSDLSGRDKVTKNVLYSWGGYLLIFIGGFVMPRLIDESIGKERLGIWDLAWGLVHYLNITMLGIGDSVNHFVARYRSLNDQESLKTTLSTVFYMQTFVGFVIFVFTLILTFNLDNIFGEKILPYLNEARWVVFFLGISLAVQAALESSRGILTGYYRWDVLNTINSIFYVFQVSMMLVALYFDTGLVGLSVAYATVSLLLELTRMIVAKRMSPVPNFNLKYFKLKEAKALFRYGLKIITSGVTAIILLQSSKILVAMNLGAGALAIYARPLAICLALKSFVDKYANVLRPTTSALLANRDEEEIKKLFVSSVRTAAFISFPPVVYLMIYGDSVLYHWMGSDYVNQQLLVILVAGFLLSFPQQPVIQILAGMNKLGRISILVLVSTLLVYISACLAVYLYGWNLEMAALSFAVPFALGYGVILPYQACKIIDISFWRFLREVFASPLIIVFMYSVVLLPTRVIIEPLSGAGFIFSVAISIVYFVPVYWLYVLPGTIKSTIVGKIRSVLPGGR